MTLPVIRKRNQRRREKNSRLENIAVLDMETDPFDNVTQENIFPFMAVLYSDNFEPVVIWQENFRDFIDEVYAAIITLPATYTIYAHNGGKFDFMFLISKLRNKVIFKGRGIMSAKIGNHELRDSYHILPEKLANMAKQNFDYAEKLHKDKRNKYKDEIIKYCISDCVNILFFIKQFVASNGFKISIGAASISKLSETIKVDSISEGTDERLRAFYLGGRVECIAGAGYFNGDIKLYDVNSMYPYAMSNYNHPIGADYFFRQGKPNENTFFVHLSCGNNGAFLRRGKDGLDATVSHGEFFVSIYEYNMAIDLDLIYDVNIYQCVDCLKSTNFASFVEPLYAQRAREKLLLDTMSPEHNDYLTTKFNVLQLKLFLNNCYGKFAQNPRDFKEHYLTDVGERPAVDCGLLPEFADSEYWIWSRPTEHRRFFNVGTSASITGAARAILMRAIQHAINPLYCDTDSIICYGLRNHELDKFKLGAWDLEQQISEIVIAGKKLYAYKTSDGKETVKSKGANGLSFNDILAMLKGSVYKSVNFGPTLTRRGTQAYITRSIRATVTEKIPYMKGTIK